MVFRLLFFLIPLISYHAGEIADTGSQANTPNDSNTPSLAQFNFVVVVVVSALWEKKRTRRDLNPESFSLEGVVDTYYDT